jgi:hypothetical protein
MNKDDYKKGIDDFVVQGIAQKRVKLKNLMKSCQLADD